VSEIMTRFNVFYDTPKGLKKYCLCNMDIQEATKQLVNFKRRYLNSDGTGKTYPNGKGVYDVSNPRILPV